mmetsp:Transcript_18622/g.31367  ORF Transcript_18622/g.31367 Transcript_18622/m.31367 type:complete len:248 (-) Transcript_18622:1181-1924(-)
MDDAFEHVFGEGEALLQGGEADRIPRGTAGAHRVFVECQHHNGLQGRHLQVEALLSERALHHGLTVRKRPGQAPVRGLCIVVFLVHLCTALQNRGQRGAELIVVRPVPRREHLHCELQLAKASVLLVFLAIFLKILRVLSSNAQIVQHTFHFASELSTTFQFQFADHQSLHIIRSRPLVEQATRKLVAIDFGEQILVCEIGEQLHGLLQVFLHLDIAQLLAGPRLQQAVAEGTDQVGRFESAHVAVD